MNRSSQSRRFPLVCVLLIALAAGCGSGDEGPHAVPVTGKVTVDGVAIKGAGVSFRPDKSKDNTSEFMPGGSTDADGKYELITTASSTGAPPGWYKVVVMPPTAPPGSNIVIDAPKYNPKYTSPETTDLEFEVKEDSGPVTFDIKLEK